MSPNSRSSKSISLSSDGEMMIDDAIQKIMDYGKEAEDKIERLVDRMQASDASYGSRSSQISRPSNEDARDMKFQRKLSDEFRKYAEQTTLRVIMVLKEVAQMKTLMIKAYVQQILKLQNEDPAQFLRSIANLELPMEEYMQFTQNDQMGFYVLSHFFLYATYVQPLQHVGADKDYWTHMSREILNSVSSTPLVQSFFEFLSKHKDHIEMIGFEVQDLINGMKVKFTSELHALYDMMIHIPTKMTVGNQAFVYRMDQAYMLAADYLMKSHQHGFVQQIRVYLRGLEQQIGMATGIQVGGAKNTRKAVKKSNVKFVFKRFTALGPKKSVL